MAPTSTSFLNLAQELRDQIYSELFPAGLEFNIADLCNAFEGKAEHKEEVSEGPFATLLAFPQLLDEICEALVRSGQGILELQPSQNLSWLSQLPVSIRNTVKTVDFSELDFDLKSDSLDSTEPEATNLSTLFPNIEKFRVGSYIEMNRIALRLGGYQEYFSLKDRTGRGLKLNRSKHGKSCYVECARCQKAESARQRANYILSYFWPAEKAKPEMVLRVLFVRKNPNGRGRIFPAHNAEYSLTQHKVTQGSELFGLRTFGNLTTSAGSGMNRWYHGDSWIVLPGWMTKEMRKDVELSISRKTLG